MSDLLTRVKQSIANNEVPQPSPIVSEALGLITNNTIPLSERLPKIYSLMDQAYDKGGVERERCGYIVESLYASATKDEFIMIKQFEESI